MDLYGAALKPAGQESYQSRIDILVGMKAK